MSAERKKRLLGAVVLVAVGSATLLVLALRDDHDGTEGAVSSRHENVFAALRARPLREPRLPGQTCKAPQSFAAVALPSAFPVEGALGDGPVHPVSKAIPRFLDFFPPQGGVPSRGSGWWFNETMWVSEPSYVGPVLVRGRKVGSAERVGYGRQRQPEWELRLPAGAWDEAQGRVHIWDTSVSAPPHWRVRRAYTRVRARGRGELCYFFQLDGRSFSQSVMFGVIVQF